MSSEADKIAAMLRMADPEKNQSYQERKNALDMAHRQMDKLGVSYASLGFSQSDAERIETQFSVSANAKPKQQPKEKRVSIFSRSDEIAVSNPPHYSPQPTPSRRKPAVQVPDWEAENERKQRDESDKRYADWEKWRHAEDFKEAKSAEEAGRFIKKFLVGLVLVIVVGAFIVFSQNPALISAAELVAKIFAGIFIGLLGFFAFFVLR